MLYRADVVLREHNRSLPTQGRCWKEYFYRTFEVYTKLWKFQRENRAILEEKGLYGLKRWEIGEIASRIGRESSQYRCVYLTTAKQ